MDVDGHPLTHAGTSAVQSTQVALTPFNHSPMTDRGRQIVARARVESPHLVASPPVAPREPSPSRVRIFMQGRTRPVSVPLRVQQPLTPSSTSPQTVSVVPPTSVVQQPAASSLHAQRTVGS
jgi:hypothetical protein